MSDQARDLPLTRPVTRLSRSIISQRDDRIAERMFRSFALSTSRFLRLYGSPIAMPPKRTASSVPKRKAISDSDDDTQTGSQSQSASGSQNKKAKTTPADVAPNGQPTNKVLPAKIIFPEKTAGTWRISSWNVSGLAAAQKKVRRWTCLRIIRIVIDHRRDSKIT